MKSRFTPVVGFQVFVLTFACVVGCTRSGDVARDGAVSDGAISDGAISDGAVSDGAAATDADGAAEQRPRQDDEFLTIGSPAPAITASSWVKGEPFTEFKKDQIYVVEFWATWCGPCRQSMPHMSSLQDEYGARVRFVGFSDEDEETVRGFLQQPQSDSRSWDQTITYSLAMDDGRATSSAYMEAAGQGGIPTAFIVGRDGVIEWIGHPLSMDEPLQEIVEGSWDRIAARESFEAAERAERARTKAMTGIGQALENEDWDAALAALQPLLIEFPDDSMASRLKIMILQRAGRTDEVQQLQTEVVDSNWDNADQLNEIAWSIATGPQPGDLTLAMRAAERANELTDASNASILDTLARVHYELGDLDAAIQWQQKAVAAEPNLDSLAETLRRYQTEKD